MKAVQHVLVLVAVGSPSEKASFSTLDVAGRP